MRRAFKTLSGFLDTIYKDDPKAREEFDVFMEEHIMSRALCKLRHMYNLTQDQVAERMCISVQDVDAIESMSNSEIIKEPYLRYIWAVIGYY